MNINDQAVWVGQKKSVVAGQTVHLQHDPRAAGLKLRNPDLFQKTIVHIKTLADESGCKPGVAQVEENAVRAINSLGTKFDVALYVNGDPGVVGRGPVPNSGHSRQLIRIVQGRRRRDIRLRVGVRLLGFRRVALGSL